jgi:chemotaxis protein histidine kinase CheA
MSASAKDLPDADLEKLIREKHRQALAEPGARAQGHARVNVNAPGERHGGGFRDDPPMTAPTLDRLGGPTLAIDPSDRVLPVTAASRSSKSLVPLVVLVVAIAAIAAVVTWTQAGSGNFAIFSSPTVTPGASTTDFSVAAENKPPVGQGAPTPAAAPAQAAAPVSSAAPVQAAAPEQPAPAQPASAQPAATVATPAPVPASAQSSAPEVQQVEKKVAVPVQQKAPEKKTVKPAEKPKQAAEKKAKPAEKPKQAAAKPKPAADDGDASFSTLLNSLTTEAPQSEPAAPTNTPQSVQQPATAPKSGTPLPTSTAPSTPGTQLFNP